MNDFTVEVQRNPKFVLDIESNIIASVPLSESTITVCSSDKQDSVLVIDAVSVSELNNLIVENFITYNLEILNNNGMTQYVTPDSIPIESLVGNLHVSRISGLDDYLNSYAFDCGTP